MKSEDSTKFFLELNGVRQLDTAHYNIKVVGIKNQSNSVKLILLDSNSTSAEKALYFQDMNVESTMKLVLLNGEYKLRYFGEVSMGAAPLEEDQVVVKQKTGKPNNSAPDLASMSKVEMYSYELENNSELTFNEEVENLDEGSANVQSEVQPTPHVSDSMIMDSLAPMLDSNKVYKPEILEVVYNYDGETGCSFPDFEAAELVSEISASSFSSQKIKVARKGVQGKCLTTAQVEEIASTLEFEDDKLSFIKYAYSYTYDKQNYRSLLKLFNFTNTKSDFLEFIKA